jgi:NADH:ubiquinone oxidoreductase subunit
MLIAPTNLRQPPELAECSPEHGPGTGQSRQEDAMEFMKRMFTWWNSQTLNTQYFTWRNGVLVGEDAEGNKFYQTKDGAKRWVIYNGEAEASRVTPDWHGWLHYTYKEAPGEAPLVHKSWEKPHQENLTGTVEAYVPAGSLRAAKVADRSDYEAWRPE